MKKEAMSITLLFPVLNEKLRLEKGIEQTMAYMQKNVTIPYRLLILDNGSTDDTPGIGKRLEAKYPQVRYVRVGERGVGVAFRKGIELNESDIVGYMDIDLSTDLKYLGKTIHLFETLPQLDYVNGTRFSKQSDTRGRKWYRKITSAGLVFLLKAVFDMKATDAVCGFTFLRKEAAERLVEESSKENGWFYTIEFLLRAERDKMNICDLPVEWQEDYNTTVKVAKTVKNYLVQMVKLKKAFHQEDLRKASRG
ncbi:MAG: glycosyltransferase [Lachnospiraceae bacterium]